MKTFTDLTYFDEINNVYRWKESDLIPSEDILTIVDVGSEMVQRSNKLRVAEAIAADTNDELNQYIEVALSSNIAVFNTYAHDGCP